MKIYSLLVLNLLFSTVAVAYIPRAMLILHKTAENSGNGLYQIEQEVQFPTATEPIILRESWSIENESTMRLVVSGTKEYKDLIHLSFLYIGGQRLSIIAGQRQTKKIGEDFLEKYLHFRSSEFFANALINMKIVPATIFNKKIVKTTKDIEHSPENYVRLARTGGVLSYAFGLPSSTEAADLNPGLWIEQDQFVVRKIRLPSQVEMQTERFTQYPRGLMFPRKRTIHWDNNTVQIQTLSVVSKSLQPSLFSVNSLDATKSDGLDSLSNKTMIEDFYKRFR